jgi:hypothetical protein
VCDGTALAIDFRDPAFELVIGLGEDIFECGPRAHAEDRFFLALAPELGSLNAPEAQRRLEADRGEGRPVDGVGHA